MVPDAIFDRLAELHGQARATLARAGRALHDEAGPLLAAAGIRLQLAQMDVPEAAEQIREVLEILEQAMASIRKLSQDLNPLPVQRTGLKSALSRLAERTRENFPGPIRVSYSATATLAPEIAAALYEAAASALEQALRSGSTRVAISVRSKTRVSLQVRDNGRSGGRAKALAVPALLARQAGLELAISTGKGTIVSIRNADRRLARGRS